MMLQQPHGLGLHPTPHRFADVIGSDLAQVGGRRRAEEPPQERGREQVVQQNFGQQFFESFMAGPAVHPSAQEPMHHRVRRQESKEWDGPT